MSDTRKSANTPDLTRHNMYYAIHKGLRFGHARMLTALGVNNFANEAETEKVLAELRGLLALGRCHLESENREIHIAIETRAPGATSHAEEDHLDHEHAFTDIENLIRNIEDQPSDRRAQAGRDLYSRYALFAAADIEHMHEEETELLQTMHRLFSDDELQMIEGRIVAAIQPAYMMGFLKLIIPAMTAPERLGMLRGMKEQMPPQVFDSIITDAVRPSLDHSAYAEIESSLGLRNAA
jgi:hypothetical protein